MVKTTYQLGFLPSTSYQANPLRTEGRNGSAIGTYDATKQNPEGSGKRDDTCGNWKRTAYTRRITNKKAVEKLIQSFRQ